MLFDHPVRKAQGMAGHPGFQARSEDLQKDIRHLPGMLILPKPLIPPVPDVCQIPAVEQAAARHRLVFGCGRGDGDIRQGDDAIHPGSTAVGFLRVPVQHPHDLRPDFVALLKGACPVRREEVPGAAIICHRAALHLDVQHISIRTEHEKIPLPLPHPALVRVEKPPADHKPITKRIQRPGYLPLRPVRRIIRVVNRAEIDLGRCHVERCQRLKHKQDRAGHQIPESPFFRREHAFPNSPAP